MMLDKCRSLEAELSRETESTKMEQKLYETLLTTMTNAKDQHMTAIGDMVRDHELLEQRIKALHAQLALIETSNASKLLRAQRENERAVSEIEKVIRGTIQKK